LSEETGRRLVLTRDQLIANSHGEARSSSFTLHPSPGEARFAELAHAAQLNRHDMNVLAAAGALVTITGHRRQAVWEVTGVEPRPPVLDNAPILDFTPKLQMPTEGEDLVADYAESGPHSGPTSDGIAAPPAQCHAHGQCCRAAPHAARAPDARRRPGDRPSTSGHRERCDLSSRSEDETGMINVVVWNRVAETQRRALLGSKLMAVHGVIEREGEVVHLVAGRLVDHSHLLGRLTTRSRDFH
jgi:error-prone DNA polymerase